MLHEYREEVSALKQENAHFAKIFDEHNALDDEITAVEEERKHMSDMDLEVLKKKKLKLKDEAYAMVVEYKKNK
ncbi:MAG: DUF465 domain-containing protein [Campylobacterales bacterium]|nr:DUF465 domain-containing protein [Campylobacterales bacterium]